MKLVFLIAIFDDITERNQKQNIHWNVSLWIENIFKLFCFFSYARSNLAKLDLTWYSREYKKISPRYAEICP